MSELVEFIRARVDDDERIAIAALDGPSLSIRESDNGHVRNWGPERVLEECATKRAIADDLEKGNGSTSGQGTLWSLTRTTSRLKLNGLSR